MGWEIRPVPCPSDEELEKMEFPPLTEEEKEILRSSENPLHNELASDDPQVFRAASIKLIKQYLRGPFGG